MHGSGATPRRAVWASAVPARPAQRATGLRATPVALACAALLAPTLLPVTLPQEIKVILMLAPAVDEFLKEGSGHAAHAIVDADGKVLHGESWLGALPPTSPEPEFHSEESAGITWRTACGLRCSSGR